MRLLSELGASVHAETLYDVVCYRPGVGIIWREHFPNLVTNGGLEYLIRRGIVGQTLPTLNNASLASPGRRYPDGRRTPRAWTAATAIAVGDVVQPTAPGANGRMFLCAVAGTTHASTQPTWDNTPGATTTDNTVTWIEASLWYIGLKASGAVAGADTMSPLTRSWSEITAYSEPTRRAFNPSAPTSGSVHNGASVATFTINATVTIYGAFLADLPTKAGTGGLLYGAGNFASPQSAVNLDVINVTCTTTVT